jgi:hypothetical protein
VPTKDGIWSAWALVAAVAVGIAGAGDGKIRCRSAPIYARKIGS